LGVLGWGVGGIEAEAAMLGESLDMPLPEVVGVRLAGALAEGVTATDLVLLVTERLRAAGVVGAFVEFHGPGLAGLTLPDRATLANMAPEYGATVGFFPVDGLTLDYLRATGRDEALVETVETYFRAQGLFRTDGAPDPVYDRVVDLDLAAVRPSLAGPRRPQDRVDLGGVQEAWRAAALQTWKVDPSAPRVPIAGGGDLGHGDVVLAAITSCTNTSNPSVMLAAGLLAKKAVAAGLSRAPHVKTSLAPGSRAVTEYLGRAGLLEPLEALGFHVVGYGCTTCIGNSGPLPGDVAAAVDAGGLVVAGVLSGNRNFEGRINPKVRANYLASPPLVVAYALAGTVDRDLSSAPLGTGRDGRPIFLRDVWPSAAEIREVMSWAMDPESFRRAYAGIESGDEAWRALPAAEGDLYPWDPESTYLREPPFLRDLPAAPGPVAPILAARCLVFLGDSVTTDHISPAGAIPKDSPAGRYLADRGVAPADFNSYGSRRGNDEVMTRGTFGNIRLRNRLAPGTEGG
ncbi:MAG: aconitate hydratase AcnA, partial [Deltaproteobacteria bacterium]|nr:aconitate hydratase AcnA [Deltaproteobacteria bacterium]